MIIKDRDNDKKRNVYIKSMDSNKSKMCISGWEIMKHTTPTISWSGIYPQGYFIL